MDIFDKIKKTFPMGDEWQEMEKILNLPDKEFDILYPTFREKFEEVFNSRGFQNELLNQVSSIDISNIDEERQAFDEFIKEIE